MEWSGVMPAITTKFNDDDKWLLMGESRPETMNWIILTPLNN